MANRTRSSNRPLLAATTWPPSSSSFARLWAQSANQSVGQRPRQNRRPLRQPRRIQPPAPFPHVVPHAASTSWLIDILPLPLARTPKSARRSFSRQATIRPMKRPRMRTLLVSLAALCVAVAVALLWYQSQLAEYRREIEFSKQLNEFGCQVGWNTELPHWLSWINDSKIPEPFKRIAEVCLNSGSDDRNCAALELKEMSSVPEICISYTYLSDRVLARLSRLPSLRAVWIFISLQGSFELSEPMQSRLKQIHDGLPGVEVEEDIQVR